MAVYPLFDNRQLEDTMRAQVVLWITLLTKFGKVFFSLGIKALAFLTKIIKGAGGTKLALGAASFGGYALLFDWRFAVCILVLIGLHEYGHVWAMRRMGMATRGFYFIPFVGGVAVPESAFPSAWAEGYVAIMGPIWGLFVSGITFGIFLVTENPLFAVAATWMALINIINLIPLYPLDGGRVVHALALSARPGVGLLLMCTVTALGMTFCIAKGYWLFVWFGGLGILEQLGTRKSLEKSRPSEAMGLYLDVARSNIARILGLPSHTRIDALQIELNRLFKHSFWKHDVREARALREQYKAWRKRWDRMMNRWHNYGVQVSDPYALLTGKEILQRVAIGGTADNRTVIFEATSETIPHHDRKQFAALVDEFQRLYRRADHIAGIVSLKSRQLCARWGVPDTSMSLFLMEEDGGGDRTYIRHDAVASEEARDRAHFLAVFAFLNAQPFDKTISIHTSLLGHFGGSMNNADEQMREWCDATASLLLLFAIDSDAWTRFVKEYRSTQSQSELHMTPTQAVALVGVTILVLVTLFLIMEAGGGFEAAQGAATFFKEF